jgi:hypothetical protein
MAPKAKFSIPMGDTVNVETQTRKSKRTSRSMQAVVPLPSAKQSQPSRPSGSGPKTDTHTGQVAALGRPSHGIEVSHPLGFIEDREDDIQDFDTYEGHAQSKVCNPVYAFVPWL